MKEKPYFSIVLPTYNDARSLRFSLRTLMRQSYLSKEVIIVDDGSTDDTKTILSNMNKEFSELKVISIEHAGRSKARNIGYLNSKGRFILFGESDAIYKNNYVAQGITALVSDSNMGGVCITGDIWKLKSTFTTECIGVESRIKRKLVENGKIKPFYAWMYRREAIDAVGGFDENLSQAEDTDFFQRVKKYGYSIGVVPGINWRHRRDQTTWIFIKRCYRGGKARVLYIVKERRWKEFLKAVGFLWFLLLVFLIPTYLLLGYLILSSIIIVYFYQLYSTLKIGWQYTEKKSYLFLLPIFSAIRYFSTAIGYTFGLVIYMFKKLRG